MGRRLLRTYNVPPFTSWPPGYPLREATSTFCGQFAQRVLNGRPDWQSRAGSLLAAEICGRGYDLLAQHGIVPPGQPVYHPGRQRETYWNPRTQRIEDYPRQPAPRTQIPTVPQGQPPLRPVASQVPAPVTPQSPILPIPQTSIPGPKQVPVVPQGQPPIGPKPQAPTPKAPQPVIVQPPQVPLGRAIQPHSPVPPQLSTQGPRQGFGLSPEQLAYVQPSDQAAFDQGQRDLAAGKQAPAPSPYPQTPAPQPQGQTPSPWPNNQSPFLPGPTQPGAPVPLPPLPPVNNGPTYQPNLPTPPQTKPAAAPQVPQGTTSVFLTLGETFWPFIVVAALAQLFNIIADFFGQTAIKSQKVAIQDFFTPIFKKYVAATGLPLRDSHFLQFDPGGVQRYTLSNPLYAGLRLEFLANEAPLANYIKRNPGAGLSERVVNQFVTNAAINGWSAEATRTLWNGLLARASALS